MLNLKEKKRAKNSNNEKMFKKCLLVFTLRKSDLSKKQTSRGFLLISSVYGYVCVCGCVCVCVSLSLSHFPTNSPKSLIFSIFVSLFLSLFHTTSLALSAFLNTPLFFLFRNFPSFCFKGERFLITFILFILSLH